jgi:hypothetical protein
MTGVLSLLVGIPSSAGARWDDRWFATVAGALSGRPEDWVSAVARIGQLTDEQAWSLLSWIELAASEVVRTRSQATLDTAAFAMSIVLQSALDRRDCAIVASLLRRASGLADLDFPAAVGAGCQRAGTYGAEAFALLLQASPLLPATHLESTSGGTFSFVRADPGFDVDDLARWLDGNGQ